MKQHTRVHVHIPHGPDFRQAMNRILTDISLTGVVSKTEWHSNALCVTLRSDNLKLDAPKNLTGHPFFRDKSEIEILWTRPNFTAHKLRPGVHATFTGTLTDTRFHATHACIT